MIYNIIFRDKKEINIDLTEEEVKRLASGEVKMFEDNGNFYNMVDVIRMEKATETVIKPFRIEAPKENRKFEQISTLGYLEKVFNKMKEHGHWKDYPTYKDYCDRKEALKQ